MIKKKLLVLCTGNSCRSQIAHGYFNFFAGNMLDVYSAGTDTHGVNPMAIAVIQEDGIDISKHTSNHVSEYADIDFDFVVTVCDNAKENCPYFPATVRNFHHNFPDPAKAKGSEEQVLNEFRSVRDMVKRYTSQFVKDYISVSS